MGAKSSTQVQVASGDINTDSKTTENANYGLINLSSEPLSGGNINFLEIATFILIFIGAIYCLKVCCQRQRQRRLREMQNHLQAVATHDGSAMPMVQPAASRVPVLAPPGYPGDALASVGRNMMKQ